MVRRLTAPPGAGFHRANWDLRYPPVTPVNLKPPESDLWRDPPQGPLAAPGNYRVQLARRVAGKLELLGEPQKFESRPLWTVSLGAKERAALLDFQRKTGRLQRAVLGAVKAVEEALARVSHLERALQDAPGASPKLTEELRGLKLQLTDVSEALSGDVAVARRSEPVPPSIAARLEEVVSGHWNTIGPATATHQRNYEIAAAAFAPVLARLRTLVAVELARVENEAEAAGAPWTPGRLPTFKPE